MIHREGMRWQAMAINGKRWQAMASDGKQGQAMAINGKRWKAIASNRKRWQAMVMKGKRWQAMASDDFSGAQGGHSSKLVRVEAEAASEEGERGRGGARAAERSHGRELHTTRGGQEGR